MIRHDEKVAILAVAFILALFITALTVPAGPIVGTAPSAAPIHWGVPNHAFGKAR